MKPQSNLWTAQAHWWERIIVPASKYNPLQLTTRTAIMPDERGQIDWGAFWIREVIVLFVPWPIAVLSVPKSSYIRPVGVVIVLAILLGLTISNILWTLFRGSTSNRARI